MKHLLLFLCSFILPLIALCQGNRKVPLAQVIDDAVNNYEKYKGTLTSAGADDSTYSSLVTIEGTKDNHIASSATVLQYYAFIADSASKKNAQALLQHWKRKIKEVASDYEELPILSTSKKRRIQGYRFIGIGGKVVYSISVMYSKRKIDAYYWVLLTIAKQGTGIESEAF